MKHLKIFINLTRLNKPIGFMLLFWPCSWGLALAFDYNQDFFILLNYLFLFFMGSVLMRSAGCIFNDIVDKDLDKKVARTKERPLAAGKISVQQSFLYAIILCAFAFLILIQFNMLTITLGLGSMVLAFSYPFMKRITYWPQLFLGLTFNWGIIMAWAAAKNSVSYEIIVLYISAIFWTLGYDTIYGVQDMKDDEIIGVKSETDQEAASLTQLADEYGVLGQVGHVERFNPAFKAVQSSLQNPMFIETHRLAEFNPRGTDVSVVLDLMIHDIDIVLSVVHSPIKHIDASGVAVISDTPDISNARIVFENGCVANFTASRISLKKMRKTRFFQKNAYIAVDYLTQKVEVVKMKDAPEQADDLSILLTNAEGKKKQIYFENPSILEGNAIQDELEHFASCIHEKKKPTVSLQDGAAALEVAHKIIACIG